MNNSQTHAMSPRAKNIHDRAVVIDGLGGYAFAYPDILAGGIHAANVSLNMYACEGFEYVLNQVRRYYALLEYDPARLLLVQELEDITKAKEQGKLGIIFGLQNGAALGNDVTNLPILYKLGLRIVQLTYNEVNAIGSGCMEPRDNGLTGFGAQLIQAMNRLGILIDLSHVGWQTSKDAAEASEYPVAITHGNPFAMKALPRNRPDELIRLVAGKGGVIGATPFAAFCKSAPGKRPTLEDFLDQVDYLVQLAGVDHVGVGTDKFEGKTKEEYISEVQTRYPKLIQTRFEDRHVEGFSHITQFPRITEGLLARGYSDEDCGKILGGNFLSLFRKVWRKPLF
ncbi:MAG TPA: membrane dipeptidase [Thermodesulfobacteriota bacterium]|nr:membrane dipeptidase [Thermodesulfobacteriota bacterium]